MSNKTVTAGSQLIMHMIIRLEDGSIAENTRKTARPSRVILGDGSLSAAFEQALIGLAVGEKKEFKLEAEDAFGPVLDGNVMKFPRNQFDADIELEPGVIVEFQNKNGGELLGIVRAIADDEVTVDFNHPLAGHSLNFEVEILEIV